MSRRDERVAIVVWMIGQSERTDLKSRGIWARIESAFIMLIAPQAVYRGAAEYFANRIALGEHLEEPKP